MPKFVIERDVPGAGNLTDAQLRDMSQKSVSVLKGLGPEIQWLHSYVTGDKVYCVYLAPDEATIREHARRVGLPANRISAVRRLLDTMSENHAARSHPEHVVLEIGDEIGALIVYTDPDLHGAEIEISHRGEDAQREHKDVLERSRDGHAAANPS